MKTTSMIIVACAAWGCQQSKPKSAGSFSYDAQGTYAYAQVCRKPEAAKELTLSPQMPNYQDDISVLVAQNCLGCHGAAQPSGGLTLTDADSVEANIGEILDRMGRAAMQDGVMPPGGPLGADALMLMQKWQADGFPLEAPPPEEEEEESEEEENPGKDEEGNSDAEEDDSEGGSDAGTGGKSDDCDESSSVNDAANLKLAQDSLQTERFVQCREKGRFYDRRDGGSCDASSTPSVFACDWGQVMGVFANAPASTGVLTGYMTAHWQLDQCAVKEGLPLVSMYKLSRVGGVIKIHVKTISVRPRRTAEEAGDAQ